MKIDNYYYFDYAAATPMEKQVLEVMKPYFFVKFGNSNSHHHFGYDAKKAIDRAREIIAKSINAIPTNVIFTGGGSEAENLAVKGFCLKNMHLGKHIITTKIEHKCNLNSAHFLEKYFGFKVTYLDVDRYGFVDPKKVIKALRPDTIFVSVMMANNETGTVEPIREIGELLNEENQRRKNKIHFHSDAQQAYPYLDLDMTKMRLNSVSLNSSKVYGPKGIGCIVIDDKNKLEPLIHAGAHEFSIRGGTPNTPGIVGFSKAVEILNSYEKKERSKKYLKLKEKFLGNLKETGLNFVVNSPCKKSLPNAISISFTKTNSVKLLEYLDRKGFAVPVGSAAEAGTLKETHVIESLNLPHIYKFGTIRFTFGKYTTEEEIKTLVKTVEKFFQNK